MTLSRILRRALTIAAIVLSAPPLLTLRIAAQETQPTTFRTNVRRVIVDVVVTDKNGKPVPGLTRDDFKVLEDGTQQQVLSFDAQGFGAGMDYQPPKLPPEPANTFVNLPTTPERGPLYVLLYDLNNMDNQDQMVLTVNQHQDQIRGRQQLIKFIQSKPEGARFAIFVSSDHLHLVQGFTSDRQRLYAALDPHGARDLPMVYLMGQNTGWNDENVTLTVLDQIGSYLDGLPGRKNLIWFSGTFPLRLYPGQDDGPNYRREIYKTLDLLARNQISIYPVDVRGVVTQDYHGLGGVTSDTGTLDISGGGGPAKQGLSLIMTSYSVMDDIARETGGRAFYGRNDVSNLLVQATEDGASYYTLSYAPQSSEHDGKLHSIHVDLAQKGYTLAYRRSYYALAPADVAPVASTAPETPGGPAPELPVQRGHDDTLNAYMEHGAPEAHDLLFGAHVRPLGSPAMATSVQMNEIAEETGYFKTRRRKVVARPMPLVRLQSYAIDYTVMAHQLHLGGGSAPLRLEIASAAYDAEGGLLNAEVGSASSATGDQASTQPKSYRSEQVLFVPLNAASIRVAVRDANTNRVGAMEITLPLSPEPQNEAAVPAKPQPVR